ncbi:MAG: hypothetical protein U1E53_10605 [Dongiaceae bacterium]
MSMTVTWTKLFAYTGTVLAASYGVSAYVAGDVEARLAAWTGQLERVAAQQKTLEDGLAGLRQAIEAEQARASAEGDRRAQASTEALAAAEGRLGDRLKALEAAIAALTPGGAPAAAPAPGAASTPP